MASVPDPTKVLVLVPLVILTGRLSRHRRALNRRLTTILAWGCASVINLLNVFLLYQQFFTS